MKIYRGLKFPGIMSVLVGLFWTLDHNSYGPIAIALGIIFTTLAIFKKEEHNSNIFSIIVVAALAIMLILEYFIVQVQNITFYTILLIMSISTFLIFHFSLKPQNLLSQREKIISWTGSILFGISFFGVMGIIFNNFNLSIILGVSMSIMFVISLFIRKRLFKDDALENEFSEEYIIKDPEEYWFRYEVGKMPKPLSWQGWACYGIMFLSPFVILILSRDPTVTTVIAVAFIITIMIIAMLKSNYRECIREYKESLKENDK